MDFVLIKADFAYRFLYYGIYDPDSTSFNFATIFTLEGDDCG